MVKLSELRNAEDVRANHLQDDDYRREYERTWLANDVAIKVIQFRVLNGLSQAELARRLGMRQPNVARLESGEHEPSLKTLALLAEVLGQDFSVDVKPGKLKLRHPARNTRAHLQGRGRNSTSRSARIRASSITNIGGTPTATVVASVKSPKNSNDKSIASSGRKTQSTRTDCG